MAKKQESIFVEVAFRLAGGKTPVAMAKGKPTSKPTEIELQTVGGRTIARATVFAEIGTTTISKGYQLVFRFPGTGDPTEIHTWAGD